MSPRHVFAVLAVSCGLLAAGAQVAAAGQSQPKESGNPIDDQGSSYHYRTCVTSITPHVPGLGVEVLEFADRLLLRNDTGRTVTIYGYEGEPYARVLANGTAEQNVRSPAVYLNTNFYAEVTVPSSARASDPPRWQVIDRTGQFEWHDHRIHWMSPARPPQVKDPGTRTRIFSWRVPIRVGGRGGAISGELFWVPETSKAPVAAIVALAAIVLASIAFSVLIRRRRRRRVLASDPTPGAGEEPRSEAW